MMRPLALLLLGASMLLLPALAQAQIEDERFNRRMRPMSWQVSLGGGASLDGVDYFQYGGAIDAGFGKHSPFRNGKPGAQGDWLHITLRYDSAARSTIGLRYGWLLSWHHPKWAYHLGFYATAGAILAPNDRLASGVTVDPFIGGEVDMAWLFQVAKPKGKMRPLLGPAFIVRGLAFPGIISVGLSLRFAYDAPILREEDL